MPGQTSPSLRPAEPTPELLLREVVPGAACDVVERLRELGWSVDHLAAWDRGAPAVVLYDPADGRVLGAGLACAVWPRTFQLLAVTVADDLADRDALCDRVVQALGDRVRRLGGERLTASAPVSGLSDAQLEAAGFRRVATSAPPSTSSPEPIELEYLQL